MQIERMTSTDLPWATAVLVGAFTGHPPGLQLFRETNAATKLDYFMRCTCKYALMFGECHASADKAGVALWLLPGATQMTPWRMFRAGMFAAPFHLGRATSSRLALSRSTATGCIGRPCRSRTIIYLLSAFAPIDKLAASAALWWPICLSARHAKRSRSTLKRRIQRTSACMSGSALRSLATNAFLA
jgi:hypothetical protein